MMKKLTACLLALVMALSLCACGGKGGAFTVTCKDGTTETLTREELEDLYSNELKYQQKYDGAHVEGEGKIDSIETSVVTSTGKVESVKIGIDSFTTVLVDVPAAYAADLDVGDTIVVSGSIRCRMEGFVDIVADGYYTENLDIDQDAQAVCDGLNVALDKLRFVKENIGATAGAEYAEEFLTKLETALTAADEAYISENFPKTAEA